MKAKDVAVGDTIEGGVVVNVNVTPAMFKDGGTVGYIDIDYPEAKIRHMCMPENDFLDGTGQMIRRNEVPNRQAALIFAGVTRES